MVDSNELADAGEDICRYCGRPMPRQIGKFYCNMPCRLRASRRRMAITRKEKADAQAARSKDAGNGTAKVKRQSTFNRSAKGGPVASVIAEFNLASGPLPPITGGKSFINLKACECKYELHGTRDLNLRSSEYRFCAAVTRPGSPWCEDHSNLINRNDARYKHG